MQDEHTPYGTKTPAASSAGTPESEVSKQWDAFQRDLDVLGRQLAEIGTHGAALGEHFLASLRTRFDEVKDRATSYKAATEQEIEAARRMAQAQAESTLDDVRARSTEAAKQMWEKAQPLREGAKDVGEGLLRAWGELRASFGKAAQRLHTEGQQANGTAPVPTEDRRETT
ncbi:hypothetical protein [Methyloceanibacter sp.]|uniref:hypothetical protein n=1 Tax=Methyloceanibacter sp. TaxID=1965321 RepID=UPI00351AB63A